MKTYINPFHLIKSIEKKGSANPLNRIFGPSPIVSEEKWPQKEGIFYNHVISLETSELDFPKGKNIAGISIFMTPSSIQQLKSELFEIVMVDKKDIKPIKTDYPKNYKPWWKENPKAAEFESGIPYKLEPNKDIPHRMIKDALYSTEDYYLIPPEFEEIEDYGSYVGGFPIWVQGNETPVQDNGENAHFLMKLSGFDPMFQMSILDGYDLYLFLTEKGKLLAVGQS